MGTQEQNLYGISDLPLGADDPNRLGTEDYIAGLVRFIGACQTPMSVALQGDWGTGKSSFINQMIKAFTSDEYKDNVTTVYFNTWQYSQFNMSGDLYQSFLLNIIDGVGKNKPHISENGKNMLTKLGKVVASGAKQYADHKLGIDLSESFEAVASLVQQRNDSVSQLKDDFARMISDVAKNGRVIIFVDDLDRLNPEAAVELLEVMKLFMDVPKCVFVLAIDYGVVVKGVRAKYGADMNDEKCRSFFDKIIQLPFRMPVENYTIEKLVETTFAGDLGKESVSTMSALLKDTLGMNPRTFKRLYNSFTLLRLVHDANKKNEKSKLDEKGKTLLLASLVVQISSICASDLLLDRIDDSENMQALLENPQNAVIPEGEEKTHKLTAEEKQAVRILEQLQHTLGKIAAQFGDKEIYGSLCAILQLTSITGVSKAEEPVKRQKAIQIDTIVLRGDEDLTIKVKNARAAAQTTIEHLLQSHEDRVEGVLQSFAAFLTTDSARAEKKTSLYRQSAVLQYCHNGVPVYFGSSSSTELKMEQVNQLCRHLQVASGSVVWKNGEEIIFSNT